MRERAPPRPSAPRRAPPPSAAAAYAVAGAVSSATWKWDFSRVLDIQQGFQYGPYNQPGISIRSLQFNRDLKRVLEIHRRWGPTASVARGDTEAASPRNNTCAMPPHQHGGSVGS